MSTPDEIFDAVQSLPFAARWQLVTRLWDSLPPADLPPLSEADIELFDDRMNEINRGAAKTIPWSEARLHMYSRLEKGHT